MRKNIDLTSRRFGKLVVIARTEDYADHKGKKYTRWICKCDCGKEKDIVSSSLLSGSTKSCGCAQYDSKRKHGMYGTKLYHIWSGMKQRCQTENNSRYKDYGGRGITVCPEWNKFEGFAKWAEKSGYEDGLSIERKDVNGNYCPYNCEWIPFVEQARNRRPSLRLKDKEGNVRLMVDISEEIGIDPNIVRARHSAGWDLEKALYTPLITQTVRKPVLKIDLETGNVLKEYNSIGKAAEDTGIDRSGISRCCAGKLKKAGRYGWKYANKV